MNNPHQPVLVDIVTKLLLETGGKTFLDITVGGGGFLKDLLRKSPGPLNLFGIDIDPQAITRCRQGMKGAKRVTLATGDHGNLYETVNQWSTRKFSGIIGDFGQSAEQLDDHERGFSFKKSSNLDMRYSDQIEITAAEFVNNLSHRELLTLLRQSGERLAGPIASSIIRNRPLQTTDQLVAAIRKVCPVKHLDKTLSRCFMILRVAVNNEHQAIEKSLPVVLDLLEPGGRMVFLAYDSGQDLIIKNFLKFWASDCICQPGLPICVCNHKPKIRLLNRKVIVPSKEEIESNPKARSGRLRAAEKLVGGE